MKKITRNKRQIELEDFRVCHDCIGESFLKAQIKKTGVKGTCLYCKEKGVSFSLEEISNRVEQAIDEHYELTPEENLFGGRDGFPITNVISDIAEADEDLAASIREVLETKHQDRSRDEIGEEGPFDEDAHYREKDIDDSAFNNEWEHFECCLKTQNRYFGQIGVLQKIFDQIVNFKTKDQKLVVVEAGPGTNISVLYRARVMQSDDAVETALRNPEKEIGPPPPSKSTNGRMNAKGISVFYGALAPEIAIEEVRPPMGCRVLVGKFDITRKIRLLDVEALRSIFIEGSVFDPSYITRWEHAKFLGRLSHRISMPVMPDDEPTDYLITQVIADYLSSNANLSIDGLIYPSVMGKGAKKNVVLFQKSARVLMEEESSEIDVSLGSFDGDGYENDYWVWEKVEPDTPETIELMPSPFQDGPSKDDRPLTLRLDRNELFVHHIEKIQVTTTPYSVRWHKNLKSKEPQF